jgi:hypothetical protein
MNHTLMSGGYRLWAWLRPARRHHDPFLVLSLTGFNFSSGWEQLVLKNQTRSWR